MIYLDNSATTNPKPSAVKNSSSNALNMYSFNSGRGGYKQSVSTAEKIFEVREKISTLVGSEVQNVAFMQNCTLSLNMAIKGVATRGSHIIISSVEHNAVARTVYALSQYGNVTYDVVPFSYDEEEFLNNVKKCIRQNTSVGVFTGASNVFGVTLPLKRIGELLHKNGILMIVDSAQSLGIFDTNIKRDNIDILCGAGHKGLYGPMGTGFMAVGENVRLNTIIEGGTGSSSLTLEQPIFLPDRLESGTLNNSGIIGLGAGVDFVRARGVGRIYSHELELICCLYDALERDKNVTLYTKHPRSFRSAPILSFNYKDYPSEKTASLLADRGIAVRAGLHCAPLAHNQFGTQERGTVRISPSVFTTKRECQLFLNELKKL